MNNNNNNNNSKKGIFVNGTQRKFYLITRAFKIGNIVGTGILVLYILESL